MGTKGTGWPHPLHILQEDIAGGLVGDILRLGAMVVVVVAVVVNFVAGNRAHRFAGLFALVGTKCPMSRFLYFLLPFDLSLALLMGKFFLVNWMGFG